MIQRKYSNSGVSMLYVLAALMVTGFIATAMLKMSTSGNMSNAHYSTSASARSAANSGLIYAIQQFESPVKADDNIALINKWVKAETGITLTEADRFYVGTAANYFTLPGTNLQAKVEILAFDKVRQNITLRSEGLGNGDARATITGVYFLNGLAESSTPPSDPTVAPMAAFRLAGNSDYESNFDVEVTGLAFVSGKLSANCKWTFNDDFYQEVGTYVNVWNQENTFNKKAFIGGHADLVAQQTFNGSVGFGGGVRSNSFSVGGDLYHSGVKYGFGGTSRSFTAQLYQQSINVNGNSVYSKTGTYYPNGATYDYIHDMCTSVNPSQSLASKELASNADIPTLMGFDAMPPEITFDETVIAPANITNYYTNGRISGAGVDALYDIAYKAGDTICGGFMVMRGSNVTTSGELFYNNAGKIGENNGTTVDGSQIPPTRVVFVWEGNGMLSTFPSTTTSANVILLCKANDEEKVFGGFEYFRGVVYVKPQGYQFIPGGAAGATIEGATYFDVGARHYTAAAHSIHYKYSESVLEEIACAGLLDFVGNGTPTTSTVIEGQPVFELRDGWPNPISTMISQSF